MDKRIVFFIIILIAISAATTGIYRRTQQADINYYKGRRSFLNGRYAEAKEFLLQSLKFNPGDRRARILLAQAMQYSGQAKEAIKIYEELLGQEK
jgi:tetratricopeptide (TPR) repeat protein